MGRRERACVACVFGFCVKVKQTGSRVPPSTSIYTHLHPPFPKNNNNDIHTMQVYIPALKSYILQFAPPIPPPTPTAAAAVAASAKENSIPPPPPESPPPSGQKQQQQPAQAGGKGKGVCEREGRRGEEGLDSVCK